MYSNTPLLLIILSSGQCNVFLSLREGGSSNNGSYSQHNYATKGFMVYMKVVIPVSIISLCFLDIFIYMYVCMRIHVCVHVCMHKHIHTYMHTQTHTHIYVYDIYIDI